ncbi:unnamed protein product [Brassica rapa]|uniref:Uncharacterized protein n=2 Tax=Brassica TaxID=3705 RepID=A0A3P6DC16_BRACM|nr:unnamed protein product [Brassica napus]CAG7885553.1 unnamed protein product [Brassica rapa]CDY45128.1 BnaAnng07720D [Brassica napus]VDD23728.1 unnamed protein product [Brassica rapa]
MSYSSTNIHFDYDGHYEKSGDDCELATGAERVDSVVNGEGDNGGIGGIGLDKMDSVENEGDVDNSMGVRPISDYIELSRVAKEISVVKEWEDGLGFLLLQEFPSK